MDVYVGIEGVNIAADAHIAMEELGNDKKPKLSLTIKPQQDISGGPLLGQFSASTSKQPQNTPGAKSRK